MRALNEPSVYILIFYKNYSIIIIENKDKELINMATYKVRISSQVTIFEEEVVCVEADTPEEAKVNAGDAFREYMDTKYGWCDYDTVNIEECVKCQ